MKELTYWAPKEVKLPFFKTGGIKKDHFRVLKNIEGLFTSGPRVQSTVIPSNTEGQVQNKFHEDGVKEAFDTYNKDLYERIKKVKGYL